ncbi:MAG: ArsA family ATPase [Deltaproteobacteria bacterium]|nr:ArsA family ATPase [Deltaproteobacteria bacterium]
MMFFSGKGGVGKTTLAAATAVHLARSGSRVLILSTDPAHNLSDVLGVPLGAEPRAVEANLEAMEVDASAMFEGLVAEGQGGAIGSMLKLVSDTPGVDEFGAIEVLLAVIERADHDAVVVDTAPTGHTLRLLMVPDLLDGWFGTLLKMRQGIARAGRLLRRLIPGAAPADGAQLEAGLLGGQQRIKVLRDQLTDPKRTQIFLVSIPEAMSVLETSRTLKMLQEHGMPAGAVVVNQIQPETDHCDHCQRRRQLHLAELENLRQRVGDVPLREVECMPRAIAGADALAEVGRLLWGDREQR